jgi:hypothetical protein
VVKVTTFEQSLEEKPSKNSEEYFKNTEESFEEHKTH